MKVGFCLDINKKDASSGKHKFFIRLAREMQQHGIQIDNNKPDIFLSLVGKENNKAKLNVLRLDGLIMNTRWNYKDKNKKILKFIKQADALIYQGLFCKEAYNKFLKVKDNKPYNIISNGALLSEFFNRNPKNYFLANCKWRPHKRLKSIVKSYLLALEMGLQSDLIITGKPDYKYNHPKIKYLGWQDYKKLKKLLSGAIASLHLTWLDWCPNSMIEAIVSKCPIIYTKSGGQTELGKGSGIGIEDTQWDFTPIDLYCPPEINKKKVAEAMLYLENNKNKRYTNRLDLNIKIVCKEYINYFKIILKEKK